ncbi:tRNA (adenosine(37)-N6)-dimethylallyltransferase MiaA [Candidatus Parcubacteria bacterium]|nr:tRNA (adenosine(37)-N6)-dimethylallyltransferase MiaA [Patescibacteria group bacterium]MBU4466808.1 tRNA (adenosine(37)-N6)-dimethylallyltransferase MiaA [Patescibacteria group bacterium]MCG2688225.1 tRNA (adenosine(37)-N6)-dimethylallyltransferase MiaA [Candidatus Parcubacteria bacterium]
MKKIVVILGPTASGKTDLSIRLAKRFNGEIVSADSRQIFKEMDVGTAKPKLRRGYFNKVRHHLINSLALNNELTVTIYKKLALKAIRDIQKRGKLPFLVGGTGLYIRAVVDNLDFPKAVPDEKLRRKLEAKSLKDLFQLYKKLDPEGAKVIDKNNQRRLVRAIEVCLKTKQPFWQQRNKKKPLFRALEIGIRPSKTVLASNIRRRTDQMLRLGLEREAKKLFKKYGIASILSQTIGYLEWLPQSEARPKQQIIKEINNHSRQYAKRQLTWFKKDSRIIWLKPKDCFPKSIELINRFITP